MERPRPNYEPLLVFKRLMFKCIVVTLFPRLFMQKSNSELQVDYSLSVTINMWIAARYCLNLCGIDMIIYDMNVKCRMKKRCKSCLITHCGENSWIFRDAADQTLPVA
jgi:hypothetical protein